MFKKILDFVIKKNVSINWQDIIFNGQLNNDNALQNCDKSEHLLNMELRFI